MATFDLGRVTPIYKGDYSASASYELNDVVLYNGNLYWHVQATATVGILPTDTTVWQLAFADEGVRAEIRGYADDAQVSKTAAAQSALQASASASNASASASQASASAQAASTKASEASTSAQTASSKASEATVSAQSAASEAQTATDKATLASQKAAAASESASIANEAKTAAITNAQLSVTKADEARNSATQAAASATSAQEYNESAQQSAVNAQTSATNAAASEAAAKRYAEDSAAYLGAYPTDTAEGEIASFSDGADDVPMKSLVVGIEPVQDLHGYDAPWPAGGGKNKLGFLTDIDTTVQGVRLTFDKNTEQFNVSGTNTDTNTSGHLIYRWYASGNKAQFPNFEVGKTYTLFNDNTTIRNMYMQFTYTNTSGTVFPMGYINMSNGKTTFTVPDNFDVLREFQIYVSGSATELNGAFHVWLEEGSVSSSTFAPYSNICPITGWTGAKIEKRGKNLFPSGLTNDDFTKSGLSITPIDNGYKLRALSASGYLWCRCKISDGKFFAGKVLTLSGYVSVEHDENPDIRIQLRTKDNSVYGDFRSAGTGQSHSVAVTIPSDFDGTVWAMLYHTNSVVAQAGWEVTWSNLQLEIGSTATAYEPCSSETIDISFPSEAGTVYGGSLDVLSGVLTVDRAMVTFDGSSDEHWSLQSINSYGIANFSVPVLHYPERNYKSACNMLAPQVSAIAVASTEGYYIHQNGATVYIRISVDRASTVDELIALLAQNNIQLVYSLAEPIEIQLSPNQINSLLGTNNIFADTGDCSVEYRADTKMYIERLTEPDADMIADSNIVSGQYFMVGNSLYLATANIASGGQVIVGTNCTRKSLSEALNEINQ